MWNRAVNARRVVVGLDFSPASMVAARWAASWLLKDRELILAHALVLPQVDGLIAYRYPIPDSLLVNARSGALRRLHDASVSLDVPDAMLEVREGDPADAIAEVSRDLNGELIVVGRHGEGGPHRGYTGRTADRLVRSSPAPVLVADGALSRAPRKILVALTYSSITPLVVDWTRRMSEDSGAEVVAIHVVGSAVLSHVLSSSAVKRNEILTAAQIDEVFQEDGDRWKQELVSAGVASYKVHSEVVFGEVSTAVMEAARQHDADMIVMGSHAGPLRRLLLGSAATAVLRESHVPVLIVVEPAEADRKAKVEDAGEVDIPAGVT